MKKILNDSHTSYKIKKTTTSTRIYNQITFKF